MSTLTTLQISCFACTFWQTKKNTKRQCWWCNCQIISQYFSTFY